MKNEITRRISDAEVRDTFAELSMHLKLKEV